ncbi:MAG: acyl-CoA dehydrogenase [Syntrophomonadaceae bacterium]|nr:acyl-CoA dehydrogenase [Syntrophomonadaceae bacterium]
MSFSDRNNPYNFNDFLEWRQNCDYYRDDLFFQKVVKHYTGDQWQLVDEEARKISPKTSLRWRDISDAIGWPEKRPYMMHYDGHKNRIDRIVRPHETEVMEKEIFAEAMYSEKTSPWVRLVKIYLISQNGEACITCPTACTEGLVTILRRYADTPELQHILKHCSEGIDGDFGIGAQYISEIQGGSDIQANVLEAVQDGNTWRLYGIKHFCSATHADYSLVTAKPAGSEKVALFVVPSWLQGDKEKEKRNGFTIDRIKYKMGTSELTTGELTYDGAIAYPVGPLDRGVANVVGIVLTLSRLGLGNGSAAFMTRSVREAKKYAELRDAFGTKIGHFPLLAAQLNKADQLAKQTTAGVFRLYRDFLQMESGLMGGLVTSKNEETNKRTFEVRELIMLQKIGAAWDATDVLRTAMSAFGGHGVMEDFSSLPRLYRDAAVNELWEGPRNVLLTQIHRDFQRASSWYSPAEFVERILKGSDPAEVKSLALEMTELISHPSLMQMDDKTFEICERWDKFCHNLIHAYQAAAVQEME